MRSVVKVGKICGRQSLTTKSGILSYPGASLDRIAIKISRNLEQDTS